MHGSATTTGLPIFLLCLSVVGGVGMERLPEALNTSVSRSRMRIFLIMVDVLLRKDLNSLVLLGYDVCCVCFMARFLPTNHERKNSVKTDSSP